MASVSLDTFFSDITIHVDGCPEPVMAKAVLNTLIDFCADTKVWREYVDCGTVRAASFPYDLGGNAGAVVAGLLDVRINGYPLEATNETTLDAIRVEWQDDRGTPAGYYLTDPDTLMVYPLPDMDYQMRVSQYYTPSRDATAVPSYLHQRYATIIAAGTVAQLMAIPNKPWSNPQFAAVWSNRFGAKKAEVKIAVNQSMVMSNTRVSLRGAWR